MRLSVAVEELAGAAEFRPLAGIAGIAVDLRYASANNFLGRDLYAPFDCAWLHRDAAAALERVVAALAARRPGYTALILDALRPQRVQQQLWDALAGTDLQMYLADPARGSIHSFGMALDITLLDEAGAPCDMGTGFDDMSPLSHPALEEGFAAHGELTALHIANRHLLRGVMTQAGFHGIDTEWWHYDCGDRQRVRETYRRVW